MERKSSSFDDKEKDEGLGHLHERRRPSEDKSVDRGVSPESGPVKKVSEKRVSGSERRSLESRQKSVDSFEGTWKQPDFRAAVIKRALAIIEEQVRELEAKVGGGILTMGEVRVWKEQLQRLKQFALEEGFRRWQVQEIKQLERRLRDIEKEVDKRIRERVEKEAKAYATEVYGALDEQVESAIEPIRKKIEDLRRYAHKVEESGRHRPMWQPALASAVVVFVLMLVCGIGGLIVARKTGNLTSAKQPSSVAPVTAVALTTQASTLAPMIATGILPTLPPTVTPSPTATLTPTPLSQWGIEQLVTALRGSTPPPQPCISLQQALTQNQISPPKGRQGCFAFGRDELVKLPPASDLAGVKELVFQSKPNGNKNKDELELTLRDLSGKGEKTTQSLTPYQGVYTLKSLVQRDEYLCVKTNTKSEGNQTVSEQPKINIQIGGASRGEGRFDLPLPVDNSSVYCVLLQHKYGQNMTWRGADAKELQAYTWWLIPVQAKK